MIDLTALSSKLGYEVNGSRKTFIQHQGRDGKNRLNRPIGVDPRDKIAPTSLKM